MCALSKAKSSGERVRYRLKSITTAQVEMHMVETSFQEFLRDRLILNRNICAIKYLAHILALSPRHFALTEHSQRQHLKQSINLLDGGLKTESSERHH